MSGAAAAAGTIAAGTADDWAASAYVRLKNRVDAAIDAICEEPTLKTVAEAEKLARAVGVIARAVKLVCALCARADNGGEEDEMGGRRYDPEDDERLRQQLAADCDRLDRIIEEKRDRRAERRAAEGGAAPGEAAVSSDPAGG